MTANIALQHTDINSGVAVNIICDAVTVSGKKNIVSTPYANVSGPSEVQTKAPENFKYVISGVHFTDDANTLTWDHVITLYKATYDGTNYATLNVNYGDSKVLNGLSQSTDIKVVLEVPNLPISARDSRNGYLPVGTLTFIETA